VIDWFRKLLAKTETEKVSPREPFQMSEDGISLLKKLEGCKLEAYQCSAKVWTIGYGHTEGVQKGAKITQAEAEALLTGDLVKYEKAVKENLKVKVTQNQFDAMVCLAYNIGVHAFVEKSSVLKYINLGDARKASAAFMLWVLVNKKQNIGLVNRRKAERLLFDAL